MRRFLNLFICGFIAAAGFSLPAHAVIEESWNPHAPYVTTPWYVKIDEAARQADLTYIKDMRPHHAGALTMAEAYLADPKSNNRQMRDLARGIIHNQTFEISILDRIESYQKPPLTADKEWRKIADNDMVQAVRFYRAPVPGPLNDKGDAVSARDVKFAKAMIIHHQAAIDMAKEYHHNQSARNGYLGRLNLDISVDQTQDIKLMRSLISQYEGNPDDIVITAAMVDGMEGMKHHLAMLLENQNALTNPAHGGGAEMPSGHHAHNAHNAHNAL